MHNHTMNHLVVKTQWELQFDIANGENRNLFININLISTMQCSVCLDALKVHGVSRWHDFRYMAKWSHNALNTSNVPL